MTEIYINDLQDVAAYNRNPQAYRVACELRDALSTILEPPQVVKVFTPSKAYPDLLVNNQYRIAVLVRGCEGGLYVSGELVDYEKPQQLAAALANRIQREVNALATTPPPPAATAPSTPAS